MSFVALRKRGLTGVPRRLFYFFISGKTKGIFYSKVAIFARHLGGRDRKSIIHNMLENIRFFGDFDI